MEDSTARALALAAQGGDEAARNQLVEAHLPICNRMAAVWLQHAKRGGLNSVRREDLFSDAYTYLLEHIINRFDPSRGVPFLSWVNVSLAARLSDSLRGVTLHDSRYVATDLDDLTSIPDEPDSDDLRSDLYRLLSSACTDGVITLAALDILRLMGSGLSTRKAAIEVGMAQRTAVDLVARSIKAIRQEVLGFAD